VGLPLWIKVVLAFGETVTDTGLSVTVSANYRIYFTDISL